jgi:hypothetical protein
LLSVQFLRDACGTTSEEARRALSVFGTLVKQDSERSAAAVEQLGDNPSADDFLGEMERQIAAYGVMFGTVSGFLARTCLEEPQRQHAIALTRDFVRTRLESLRRFVVSVEQQLPHEYRERAVTLAARAEFAQRRCESSE